MPDKYDRQYLERLAKKVVTGTATEDEKLFLEEYYDAFDKQPDISGQLTKKQAAVLNTEIKGSLMKHVEGHEKNAVPFKRIAVYRYAAAASILFFLGIGSYFYLHTKQQLVAQNHDVLPGTNKAILTTGHGKKFILTDAHNGQLVKNGTVVINKTAGGQLVYTGKQGPKAGEMVYDTLTIPAAGQFMVKLPDGSKMWLNALTSVRFPETFSGKERVIELMSGEAYLEVVHNAAVPFKVLVKGQTIEDIGTHFNINAYDDEATTKTTLTEGAISINKGNQSATLNPGQVAVVSSTSNLIAVKNGNPEEATAWKNGYFRFNDQNIHDIMHQLARWYNIDVSYSGTISTDGLNGKISRFKNISQVLLMLESTKLFRFKVEGRRVTVTR